MVLIIPSRENWRDDVGRFLVLPESYICFNKNAEPHIAQ